LSDDYWKGRTGSSSRSDADDPTEYDRGERERLAATQSSETDSSSTSGPGYFPTAPRAGGALDLTEFKESAAEVGREWGKDPDATLKGMLKVMAGFTILGGILGAIAGSFLHDGGLWLSWAKAFFFFASIIYVPMIIGATIVGRGTARGCLTIVFLGGLSVWMVWTYVLYPVIFSHIH
jgi:hypothetical protein